MIIEKIMEREEVEKAKNETSGEGVGAEDDKNEETEEKKSGVGASAVTKPQCPITGSRLQRRD
ncbi:hypothetical protein ACHAPE_002615 [Trichoderma viride]